ncbi:MAG: MEDS domain-containing protein [Nitrososphaera sp.]
MEPVHSLYLLEGNHDEGYPILYDKITQYALENCAIIYAVEPDTTQAVRRMRQHGVEVETLVESGALTIVDRNEMYSVEKTGLDGQALLDSWHSVMVKVKKRSIFNGILAMGSVENFFESPSYHEKLVKYEEMGGKKFNIPLEAICCYSQRAFEMLSLPNLLGVLNAHYSTVHSQSGSLEWDPQVIVELARRGMKRAFGSDDMSELFFKTLKLCYKIDEGSIASNPALLHRMLVKLLGKDSAELALRFIKDEVKKSISF